MIGTVFVGLRATLCCAAGAVAAVITHDSGLGKSFLDGLGVWALLFIPVVGLKISVPCLVAIARNVFGDLFRAIGAASVIAAAMFTSADCGGYALALDLSVLPEITMMCICVAIMFASTFIFNIPIGLSILEKKDHSYMAPGPL